MHIRCNENQNDGVLLEESMSRLMLGKVIFRLCDGRYGSVNPEICWCIDNARSLETSFRFNL